VASKQLLRRTRLLTAAGLALGVGLTLAGGAGADSSSSPQMLFERLLTTSVAGELPAGFHSARRVPYVLNDTARKHNAVGGVEIDIDRYAAIIYIVYPRRGDAVADWKETNIKRHGASWGPAPVRFPTPAVVINYSVVGKNRSGKTITNGITDLVYTSRNVIVQALTMSTTDKHHGNIKTSARLGDFALKHLKALR
jgi:hypothetical protein